MNPVVQKAAKEHLGDLDRVELIEPLDYVSFVWMMEKSYLIMSDSGGVQEEAPHLGSPVLVLRESTERPEGLDAGTSFLVGTKRAAIFKKACEFLNDRTARDAVSRSANPYGTGQASAAILEAIENFKAFN
jgi:UDP-N-acetylglucosamine 2-epimerase (non-hydrolysing)